MDATAGDSRDTPIFEEPAFLRALVENSTEGLLTIDADSQILFANPAIENILGYRPDELIGSSKMKIIPERLRPVHEAGLEQYLRTGEKHVDWNGVELPALHKDGHEVPVSVSLRHHEYDGRQLFTGIFTDITDRRRREQQLRDQKRELEEFAHVLSHDLKNPLSVARGYVDLLESEHDIEELARVERALSRLEEIIEDTTDAALNEGVEETPQVRPLRDVVQKAWNSVPTRDAELVLPGPSWNVRCREGRLAQLLENLFSNSIRHAGANVTIRVGVLEDERGFYVEDDGQGIPADVRTRLETPSGLSRERGSGYGLQIVETVVDEHGWQMAVDESVAGGARFEFDGVTMFR